MTRARIKPVIPDCYKSVSDNAIMNSAEVMRIVGLPKRSLYARMDRNQFPRPDTEFKKHRSGQVTASKAVGWKMKTIRDYVKDFDKWMDGEMICAD